MTIHLGYIHIHLAINQKLLHARYQSIQIFSWQLCIMHNHKCMFLNPIIVNMSDILPATNRNTHATDRNTVVTVAIDVNLQNTDNKVGW